MTNNNTQELLPCAHCGGEAKIKNEYTDYSTYGHIACEKCGTRTISWGILNDVIIKWNTRYTTPQPESKELLEWINEFSKGVTNLNLLELLDHCKAFIEKIATNQKENNAFRNLVAKVQPLPAIPNSVQKQSNQQD